MVEQSKSSARYRPLAAFKALRRLIADKEDTAQVFRVIEALGGPAMRAEYARFRARPGAAALLARAVPLVEVLLDRPGLAAMPAGSLGRAYLAFMEAERITADGLVAASAEVDAALEREDPALRVFVERLRDAHDLWHVVTDYGRDGHGEICLLAFMFAQLRNPGLLMIVLAGAREFSKTLPHIDAWALAYEGWCLGRAAVPLSSADWEALLPQPLDAVRRQLKVTRPNAYLGAGAHGAEAPVPAVPLAA